MQTTSRRRYETAAILASVAIFFQLCNTASAQDAFAVTLNRCVDTTRPVQDRISYCKAASEAQGLSSDEQVFAFIDLAIAYDSGSNHDAALQVLNNAAKLRPDIWQVFYNRGRVLAEKERPDEALADYKTLLQIDPAKVPMFHSGVADYRTLKDGETTDMSSSEREANRHNEAVQELNKIVAFSFARQCQARQSSTATLDAALQDCNQALTMDPGETNMLLLRGVIHMRKNQLSQGYSDFDAAVKGDPHSADAIYLRGLSQDALGNKQAAQKDIATAVSLDPAVTARFAIRTRTH